MNRRPALVGIRAVLVASVVLLAACDTNSTTPPAGSPASTEPTIQTSSLTASQTASPTSPARPTASATASALASPTTKRAAAPDYKLLSDEPPKVPLAPGRYALTANGLSGMPLAVIDTPNGYTNYDYNGWAFASPASAVGLIERFSGYWTVSGVDRDPCDLSAGQIDPGTSVDELADALAAQKLTTTTKPVPVTVGGRDGLYLELTVPTAIDFATCGTGKFNLWVSSPGGGRYMPRPGVDMLWIVDTEQGRVVLSAGYLSGVPENQVKELTDMVKSVRFVKPN
ncbi:MAG: hypothetical protein ABIM89_10150 [Mycobacteriales bacterium]